MTGQLIKEAITTLTPAPAAPRSEDQQLVTPPDTTTVDGNSSVPPDLKRKEKPVPHYLKASSTRSCHDNCKYGTHHHSTESKQKHWLPVLRRQLRRRASTGDQEIDKVEVMLPQRARPKKGQKQLKISISHVRDGNAPNAPATAKPEPADGSKAPLQEIVNDRSESLPCVGDLPAEASVPPPGINLPTDAEQRFVISHDAVADIGAAGESSDGAESIELEMPLAIQDSDDASDGNMDDGILGPSENPHEVGEKSPRVDPVSGQSANVRASSEVRSTLTVMAQAKHEQACWHGIKSKSLAADEPTKPKAEATVTRNTTSTLKGERTPHLKAAAADSEISGEPKPMRAGANASVTTTTTKFSRQKQISPAVTSAIPKVKEIKPLPSSNATDQTSVRPARLAKMKVSTAKTAPSSSLSSEKPSDRTMTVENVANNAQVLQKQQEEKVKPRPLKLSRSINMPAKTISSVKVRTVKKDKIAPPIKSSKKVPGTEDSAADDAKGAKKNRFEPASMKTRMPEVNGKESQPRKGETGTPAPRTRTLRLSKPAPVPSTMATQSPRKLTFRRGKVLNPDNGSSSTPTRRLRFKPAMAAAGATVGSRGSRVTGKGTGRSAAGARDTGTSRAEVVVLRRRRQQGGVDGDGKRQEKMLLNNVIEETASRLVSDSEARKSKVRALVGAFESVISLQEGGKAGPPATTTVARRAVLGQEAVV